MIRITDAQYAEMAREIRAFLPRRPESRYTIFYEVKGLHLSAEVYQDDCGNVETIVPTWCEYRTYDKDAPMEMTPIPNGEHYLSRFERPRLTNDFQWSELYKHFGFLK